MKFRNPYNYDADIVSHQTGLSFEDDPGLTQQHFRDECDINVIVERFLRTGEMPQVDFTEIDVSDVGDFQDAMNIVRAAEEQFAELPSKVRERFHNDPVALMRFVGSEQNRAEALALGLIQAPPKPSPAPAEPSPTPTGEAGAHAST